MNPTPPACGMAITSTSTSTVTTTTSSTTVPCAAPSVSGCFHDLGECTILDACTGLEWEKKTTEVGSGINAADLHDVDNYYNGAGLCSVRTSKHCQPSAAAETGCKAQTASTDWANGGCEQCVEGEGACNVESQGIGVITTTWQWLSQVNAANYGGHSDWRLPSEDGRNTSSTTNPRELETIRLAPCVSEGSPCIDPIFGSTAWNDYWSSSTLASALPKYGFTYGWLVSFYYVGKDEFGHDESAVWAEDKRYPGSVRAVRGGS